MCLVSFCAVCFFWGSLINIGGHFFDEKQIISADANGLAFTHILLPDWKHLSGLKGFLTAVGSLRDSSPVIYRHVGRTSTISYNGSCH